MYSSFAKVSPRKKKLKTAIRGNYSTQRFFYSRKETFFSMTCLLFQSKKNVGLGHDYIVENARKYNCICYKKGCNNLKWVSK